MKERPPEKENFESLRASRSISPPLNEKENKLDVISGLILLLPLSTFLLAVACMHESYVSETVSIFSLGVSFNHNEVNTEVTETLKFASFNLVF